MAENVITKTIKGIFSGDSDSEAPEPEKKAPEPSSQDTSILTRLTFEQLMEIVKTAVAEAKKPDLRTAKKEEEEENRKARMLADMLETVRIEIEGKAAMQNACPHIKENGRSTIMGQVHSDGKIHPLCIRCFKEFDPYAPGNEMVARGLA